MLRCCNHESSNICACKYAGRKQDNANQLQQLREFCSKQGWDVATEYVDHASGKRSDRERFQAMFEAASRREFDTVLFWS